MSSASLALALLAFGATAAIEIEFQVQAPRRARRRSAAARKARPPSPGRLSQPGDLAGADRAPRRRGRLPQRAQRRAARAPDAIRQEIDALQEIRRRQGLRAALDRDRPGGRRGVAPVAAAHPHAADRRDRRAASRPRRAAARGPAIRGASGTRPRGARRQSQLRAGGRPQSRRAVNPDDRLTRISTRAISADPAVVTEVAELYCATLQADRRALHAEAFPRPRPRLRGHPQGHGGPRRAAASELEAIGLASVPAIDGGRRGLHDARATRASPRSTATARPRSPDAVVKGLLRDTWKHDGILVTDDFSMGAVTLSREGAARRRDRGAQCRRRPDPGQLRSGSVFPRDVRPAGGRSRRPLARRSARAQRRAAAPGRGPLSRHQLRTFAREIDRPQSLPQSLIRP